MHFFTKKDKIDYVIQVVDIEQGIDDIESPMVESMHEDVFHFTKRKKITFYPKKVGKASGSVLQYHKSNKSKGTTGNITVSGKSRKGIARPGNVLHVSGNRDNLKHSAMFPVKLPEFFIKLTTETTGIVYEPFSGSGTCIIACEQLGRKCLAIELSPAYVDVAVQRWCDFVGNYEVTRNGEPYVFTPRTAVLGAGG